MAKAEIKSPLPGVFYRKPAPDQPPFKEDGDAVKVGEVIGLVEVMKSYFEVKSEFDGTLGEFLIQNQSPITAGQVVVEVN